MKTRPRILYCGDSPAGGPANYLLSVLNFIRADYTHLAPSKVLSPKILKKKFDAIILSDFAKKNLPAKSEQLIAEQVQLGAGLLMIGGWGSFSGPFGGYKNSVIERLLPITCRSRDDRTNFPGGALVTKETNHAAIKNLNFKNPPAICGMNRVYPKKDSLILLSARPIVLGGVPGSATLSARGRHYQERLRLGNGLPLLVASRVGRRLVLATDLAPHWCGGWVDWGTRTMKLKVNEKISVQIGNYYVRFVSGLLNWLVSRP